MMTRIIGFLFLLLLLVACGNDSASMAKSESYGADKELMNNFSGETYESDDLQIEPPRTAEPPPPPGADNAPAPPPQTTPQRIIYTAAARAQVEHLDTALALTLRMIERSGGYLSSQHRTNNTYEHEAELVVRLPAEQLQGALDFLPKIALTIDYQNLDSRDVTAEWIDLETRLQTKRDVRDRYVDILRNRAQKVEDILNAEDKIRVITEEIEAQEGRLRYLRDQVSLSTLTLTLYETQEYRDAGTSYSRSFWSRVGDAFGASWELIQGLVLGLITVWPLLLVGGLLFWWLIKWKRK